MPEYDPTEFWKKFKARMSKKAPDDHLNDHPDDVLDVIMAVLRDGKARIINYEPVAELPKAEVVVSDKPSFWKRHFGRLK